MLVERFREDKGHKEWALVGKKPPHRILKWFGAKKPSKDRVMKEERRIQFFKHKSGMVSVASYVRILAESMESEQEIVSKDSIPSEIVEHLSSMVHDQWTDWAKNISSKEKLSKERVDRWKKLFIPYKDLSEEMKDEDRKYAKKFLKGIKEDIIKYIKSEEI